MPATAAGRTVDIYRYVGPLSARVKSFQHPFESMDYRLAPHALAVAGEIAGFAGDAALAGPGKANHANRFFARAAARSRDAGHRDGERALGARERALRHLARGFLA